LHKQRLELEQDISRLQEQLHAEKDLRAIMEVQDEKWQLTIDEEIDVIKCNNTWEWSNLSKDLGLLTRTR